MENTIFPACVAPRDFVRSRGCDIALQSAVCVSRGLYFNSILVCFCCRERLVFWKISFLLGEEAGLKSKRSLPYFLPKDKSKPLLYFLCPRKFSTWSPTTPPPFSYSKDLPLSGLLDTSVSFQNYFKVTRSGNKDWEIYLLNYLQTMW